MSSPRCVFRPVSGIALILAASLLVATQLARAQAGSCRLEGMTATAPLISADSIGVLSLHLTLGQLRQACPATRDTVIYGGESSSAGLVFRFGTVTVMAQQTIGETPSGLQDSLPADTWTVTGTSARLPGGLTLGSRWAEVYSAYGRGLAYATDDRQTWVRFCGMPRVHIVLATKLPGHHTYTYDLGSIPPNTAIAAVVVLDEFLARTEAEARPFARLCRNRGDS